MSSTVEELIVALYDAHVLASGGSVPVADGKDAIELEVALAIEAEDRDHLAEARRRIDSTLTRARDKRRHHIKRDLTVILEALPEDGEYVDHALDMAFPLGTVDGQDKTLRNWTDKDFDGLVSTAYRQSALAADAAEELDVLVQSVRRRMSEAGAATLGDSVKRRAIA